MYNFVENFKERSMKTIHLFLSALLSLNLFYAQQQLSLIPEPQEIKYLSGNFVLSSSTKIFSNEKLKIVEENLSEFLMKYVSLNLKKTKDILQKNIILFELTNLERFADKQDAYKLLIENDRILIQSPDLHGLFNGVQTLKQILLNVYKSEKINHILIPSVEIYDYPKFRWRGLNLDCCRHFMSKEFIKRYIDLLAFQKMNILHWHLTEDQGWRIEIKKYPELTKIGAYRKYDDGSIYGGYYSQDDVKEIVEYAKSRFITVVPEIELPGHSMAALATYPELSCSGGPFEVGTLWGIYKDIYCAGNEKTFEFLENVLTEVIELFPSKYIHIGGDEALKDRWEKCPKCQQRIKSENLKDENELQSYFIKRIEKFLNSKGRQIIGWDEILEGGLAPGATVQSWRGTKGAVEAARMGHNVIVSPTTHCYFDYTIETTDVTKVYSFDPIPKELTAEQSKLVLGSEANMWTEYAPQHLVDFRLFPRITALAEVLWTYPENRNYSHFNKRLQIFYDMLDRLEVNYSFEISPLKFEEKFDKINNQFIITIKINQDELELFYTTDGSEPNKNSIKYENSIYLSKSTNLRFALYRGNKKVGETIERSYSISKANNKKVIFQIPVSKKFEGGNPSILTDGIRGTNNYRIGHYIGSQDNDFEAIIDLEELNDISRISIGFFTASSSLVLLPEYVEYFVSSDGENFIPVGKTYKYFSIKNPEWKKIDFEIEIPETNARFVKIFAKNQKQVPLWHPATGGQVWLITDEIIIE